MNNQLFAPDAKLPIGIRRKKRMNWKKLDEIKIICKRCNKEMILESTLNDTNGIYICNKCLEHVNLGSFPKETGGSRSDEKK